MYLLGYDIGSSSIKAAIVEAATRKVVLSESFPETEMEIVSAQPGWAEQSPDVWWENLCVLTRRLLQKSGIDNGDIKSIGIAYQMHGLVLLDKDGQVLRPAIIWCDSRAVAIGNQAFSALGQDYCQEHYLNSPGNFTASKLKWVKDNEPDIYRRIHKIMLPGDYIAYRLTGEIGTTVTGLSEGIFWDFKHNEPATALLDHFGFDKSILPKVLNTFGEQGRVTNAAAAETGLKTGTPVAYRAGDQPNNALSLNVLAPGEVAATGGTSGVVYGVVDSLVSDPQNRVNSFAHVNHSAAAPRIGVLLCINGAGIQYSWMRRHIAGDGVSYNDMEQLAASVPIGSAGLCMLPFGNGAERMLGNRELGAQLCNLQHNLHSKAHLYRAALEGIAFSFVYGMEILKGMGLNANVMRVGNDNLFQSAVFAHTIASTIGCNIEVLKTNGATGAAIAGGFSMGFYATLEEALQGLTVEQTFSPSESREQYLSAYRQWLACLEKILT